MRWDSTKELGSAKGLSFLFWVYLILGRWPFRLVAAPVVVWFWAFKSAPRRASRDYLSRVLERPVGIQDCLRHYFSFTEAILDKLIAWNGGFASSDLEYHGREAIDKVLASGKGCVLIGSHLGNLEIGRVLSKRPGMELHVLVHSRHAENFNKILKQLDPASQMNLHQVEDLDASLAAWLSQRVDQGAFVILTGDRVPVGTSGRVGAASFFGADADFPYGPYILAAALGWPVLLIFCLRRPPGRARGFDLYYEPFADKIVLPRADREKALQALASRYAARLEYYCAQAPYQWYNWHPFWRNSPTDERA